jgi:D-aminopeptidase
VRERLRELGFRVGRLASGPRCSLVDVPGVRVGHVTLREGDSVRTGVTAILAHGGNLYAEKVIAGCHVMNGYGKPAGLVQLEELGTLESPILLTGTLSVGPVWEGGLRNVLEHNPGAATDGDTVNVVVAEIFDGWLGDARALTVRSQHALAAIAAAGEHETAEGAVGAGTGATCFGFKSGVGCASRVVDGGHVLGCLVVSNYGGRRDLHMLVGSEAAEEHLTGGAPAADDGGGSIVIVFGTDAPLSERQLDRLAGRTAFGLGRAGSFASNASGELAIAFSTAHRLAHRQEEPFDSLRFLRDDSRAVRELFEAAGDVTHEAVLNSLCAAEAEQGRDGHRAEAFPHALVPAALGLRA